MSDQVQISGAWQVWPLARDVDTPMDGPVPSSARQVPACAHLQPALYPDQPYWGDHLRAMNDQDWMYRQSFRLERDLERGERVRLIFEGVDYYASVWLNGQFLGKHEGHFVSFAFDVTQIVRRDAENVLQLRLSSPWDERTPNGSFPTDHVLRGMVKGLYEHGEGLIPPQANPIGIWRPVWLAFDHGVRLDGVHIDTALDGTVHVRVEAANDTDTPWTGELRLAIDAENHDGPGISQTLRANIAPGKQTIEATLRIPEPQLWWPWDQGQPALYRLTVSSGQTDCHLETIFGVRTVRLERRRERFTYYVNERPVYIRGTSYMPMLYLSECTRSGLAQDIKLAREANINLLRAHVHVATPDFYDLCNREGMLVWQDFELNWAHDPSPEFEVRALGLQREMIDRLGNHPSIITWACHNEPTMIFTRRENLEQRPDPALYAAAVKQDPSRPVFLCSGQMERDWQHAGDTHSYYGAIWSERYTDVYRHAMKLNTEFGFEAPAALETLQMYPKVWERLRHLDGKIEALWAYQAELVQYHVEHLRRLRATTCAGYVHFWLNDLVPQVGCGVLDSCRRPKGGYEALKRASQPLLLSLEHEGKGPIALWVFNDTPAAYPDATAAWQVTDPNGTVILEGSLPCAIAANSTQRIAGARWKINPAAAQRIELTLRAADGTILSSNAYAHPFQPSPRPRGYPWNFDPVLGCKVFEQPGAVSLAEIGATGGGVGLIPLSWREKIAEWALRQRPPLWMLSLIARTSKQLSRVMNGNA